MTLRYYVQRFKWPLTAVLAVVIMVGSWQLAQQSPRPTPTALPLLALTESTPLMALEPTVTPTQEASPTPARIAVYVSGAVTKPGVYRLMEGARADDAVRAAGGLTSNADAARVNLAAKLRDEQQIYVPAVGEAALPVAPLLGGNTTIAATPAGAGKVNINTANLAELESLPRIGPAMAQRIIDYRTNNGPFGSVEDLQNVKGIGPATFAELKDLVTLGP